MSQREAAQFSIPRSTLGKYLKGNSVHGVKPGPSPILSMNLELKLVEYAATRAKLGFGFGNRQFKKYASDLATKHNLKFKRSTPSEKWWRSFNQRHKNTVLRKPEGTSSVRHQCMSMSKVAKYFYSLHEVLSDTRALLKPSLIWNMDESGLQMDFKPPKIIAKRGTKHLQSRTSGKRETITIIAAVNAAGGLVPPHLIAKGKTARSLHSFNTANAPSGSNWNFSKTGWTKQGIAILWFTNTFLPNIGREPQILIVDSHDSHNFVELLSVAIENNIYIVEMPVHCLHWLQPLDRTVFSPLKTYYNQTCHELMNEYPGVTIDKSTFCGLFKKAWDQALTAANIISGFRSCGIFPYNPSAVPSTAYLPNSVYSIQQLLDSNDLLESSLHPIKTDTKITRSEYAIEEEVDFKVKLINKPGNISESKIDNNLINLDNNSLIWDTHLTHEQFTTFNFCIQNGYDILDLLYKLYKEFKLKQISCTNTILEIDDSVPMPNESIVTIPFLNETIIQQVPVPNKTTGQSSFFPNKTTNNCNQMPIKAIVQPSLTPIMLCTNHSNNVSD
ncbi:uncharacterized protein LOC136088915 [Hydra vulgaris]|uniref:Uncharacterized protein LOC136088915 n=1 Tax=Hydra vulgaris TaxID=6087 RepID=A0ABM4D755_HYDVU